MKSFTSFRLAVSAFALGVWGVSPSALAQQQEQSTLNVQNADIRAFIQDVSRLTGRTFVVDPSVQGTVSVAAGGSLNADQIYEVFLSTLRAHGYAVTPTASGALRVSPDTTAAHLAAGSGAERFVTQVIRLNTRDAASVLPVIQPLIGQTGVVTAAPRANAIVITDYADNVIRLSSLIRSLDRDIDKIEVLPLANSRPTVLAQALRDIAGAGAGDQSFSAASITAVDASNSLVIRGTEDSVARLKAVAQALDEQARPTGDTRVIFLQHADAQQMVDLLQTLLNQPATYATQSGGDSTPAGAGAAGVPAMNVSAGGAYGMAGSQRGAVAKYEGVNAIVVRGDPSVQREVDSVVRQLDRRAQQVLVQAIVVEISDDAARDLGVQFLLSGNDKSNLPFFATNYSNTAPNLMSIAAALAGGSALPDDSTAKSDLQDAAIASLLNARGGIGGVSSDLGGDGMFGMILNLLQRDGQSNLLSTPSLMTLNNQEANFLVGQEVPITTGEVLSSNNNNPFRTIDRKEVGVKLTVKPQINADGSVTLKLKQEVSGVADSSLTVGEFVFNKRQIETSTLVDNGDIVVLGGLLDAGERITKEKVPGLGDIPVVGNLFKSESRDRYQTNLVVFIRPVVIGDANAARAITGPSLDRVRGLQQQFGGMGASFLDETLTLMPPAPALPPPPQTQPLETPAGEERPE
ncbi:MAG: type II secretion system secretin GspD [Hyphomonadaceae bacterium]